MGMDSHSSDRTAAMAREKYMRLSELKKEFEGWDGLPEDPEIFIYAPVNSESGLMDIRDITAFTKNWGEDKMALCIFLKDRES